MTLPPSLISHLYSLAGNVNTTVYVLSATRVAAVDGSLVSRLESVGFADGRSASFCNDRMIVKYVMHKY